MRVIGRQWSRVRIVGEGELHGWNSIVSRVKVMLLSTL
ncbi:MAG: hypothetical protein ACI9YE_000658, partial [Psychroserpens sp.]